MTERRMVDLLGYQAGLHVNVDPSLLRQIEEQAKLDGLDFRRFSVGQVVGDSDLYSLLEQVFEFPSSVTNWHAAADWMSDLEWIENPVGHVIVIDGVERLKQVNEQTFSRFIKLFPRAVEIFQQVGLQYHVIFLRADSPESSLLTQLREEATRAIPSEATRRHTGRQYKPIPVIDHAAAR
ncbi:barstar family protein [Gandjariella thermophila]|uniref:Barstar (barnase inhibitor) domain-containing protein n=1 Tax=Gandjariella thermophila TaxID=1931992 RepID=A0A4D4JFA3_9PSEU|nr:barstar family protein [Gandjariella thermophila]GDY34102.1 hypothetical protein GTS_57350 [Gandjariella thermophila]